MDVGTGGVGTGVFTGAGVGVGKRVGVGIGEGVIIGKREGVGNCIWIKGLTVSTGVSSSVSWAAEEPTSAGSAGA